MGRQSREHWKRNLYVISFGEGIAVSGFAIVFPFLPYYVQELGGNDLSEVAIWSGMAFTSHAVTMGFCPSMGFAG